YVIEVVGDFDKQFKIISKDINKEIDTFFKAGLNNLLKDDRNLLDKIVKSLSQIEQVHSDDEHDDDEAEEEKTEQQSNHHNAYKAYMKAAKAHSMALVSGKNSRSQNYTLITDIIGHFPHSDDEMKEVAVKVSIVNDLRQLINPTRRYITGLPARYRSFINHALRNGRWYQEGDRYSNDIDGLELDLLILSCLNYFHLASKRGFPTSGFTKSDMDYVIKNQILIDEVTDFSPIQVACISKMAHPKLNSVFACGDFNQRLTKWGTRSKESLEWALPEMKYQEIDQPYRQSELLSVFAARLSSADHVFEDDIDLHDSVKKGYLPTLFENASDDHQICNWIGQRIKEIESIIKSLPTIAVFVDGEEKIDPIARDLGNALEDYNIPVMPCKNGLVIGQEQQVRIFDIRHIKGLEFEAVFFIGIDRMAGDQPDLFEKFVYVGATRAASFLGMTCYDALPKQLNNVSELFSQSWDAGTCQ
ncbi:MAG: ATP-binding domain-containing protein, partial [Planctomycetes bacterium]|nr:ATP-binding domain-containing protein [Planctomycetota bacterium]